MKNTVLAPIIALLVLLAVLWTGLFGISRASTMATEKSSTPAVTAPTATPAPRATPAPTTSPRASADAGQGPDKSSGTSSKNGAKNDTGTTGRDDGSQTLADGPAPPDPPGYVDDNARPGSGTSSDQESQRRSTTQQGTSSNGSNSSGTNGTTDDGEKSFIDRFTDGEEGESASTDRSLSGGQPAGESATDSNPADPAGLSNRGAAALLLVLVLIGAAGAKRR